MTSISKSIRLLPRYILNPISSYYLRGDDASPGHQPLPEPWSTLPTSWPASNSCLRPVHSPHTTVVIFKKHLGNYITPLLKALHVLPIVITLKTHSLCQGLQVFWDLDPPSSFPIMRQSHWPTSGPSNPAADLYLTSQPLCLPILPPTTLLLDPDTTVSLPSATTQVKRQLLWKVFLNDLRKSSAIPVTPPKTAITPKTATLSFFVVSHSIYYCMKFFSTYSSVCALPPPMRKSAHWTQSFYLIQRILRYLSRYVVMAICNGMKMAISLTANIYQETQG